jgi:hypothetical protein
MYVFLRLSIGSRREALLGAFAFQLFGGFYSNAEHVDIVRSFACLPWLLACLVPPRRGEPATPGRLFALPLAVGALAAGGYPGNLVATLFSLGVLVPLQLLRRRFARSAVIWAFGAAAAVALGLAMSAIHLGPAWIYRAELVRYYATGHLQRASLGYEHLPGLVMENRGMPGDISMSSTFVGFAVLAGIAFLDRRALRRLWPYLGLLLLSMVMAAGDRAPLHPFLRGLIPPLAYSRFPSSDYRGIAAVLLILLGAAGWRALRRRPPRIREFLLRLLPLALFSAWAIARVERAIPFWPAAGLALVCFVLVVAAFLLWRSRSAPRTATCVLLAVISLDAGRVLSRMETWAVPDLMGMSRLYYPTPARMHDRGVVAAPEIFSASRPPRPPRSAGEGGYRASGYLAGTYNLDDYGGSSLAARDTITRNPIMLEFMRREWTPVLLDAPAVVSAGAADVGGLEGILAAAGPDSRIEQRSYGADTIEYGVRLEKPALLVENETFFPGWSGRLERSSGSLEIAALRVNGVFRGWPLPAGDYAMEARFRLPGLRGLAIVTLLAWLVWAILCAVRIQRRLADLRPARV